MAEARAEQDDDNMPRDAREPVVRRPPSSSGGRPDRRKPEHRHSQGPLSSIRAAIKRTSNRSTSLSETPRERERERERERDRERRRPEITILSAEPLASTSWFPGASGGFPPPPPPAAQIWGPTIPPSIQPPPSYEEVIREKSQEQVPLPSSSSSSSPSRPVSTTTIATQTDSGSSPADPHDSPVRRPVRPARPPLPHPPKSSHLDDITVAASQSAPSSADAAEPLSCDLLSDFCSPLTSCSAAQTDQWDRPPERPKPRPRSKLGVQPIGSEVKVQTLVKLREDGLVTLASRASADGSNQDAGQGTYLQELLDAFSSDDWGFPDRRSDSSSLGQSESEEEEEEDMATLRARIQAFEQQQQAAEGDAQTVDGFAKKPEPRPRPRLQGQPPKPGPPAIAPKPKHNPHGPKPSSKVFWEDGGSTAEPGEDKTEPTSADGTSRPPAEPKPGPEPQTCKTPEKPSISPKPQSVPESPAPVPAPRPPPPKLSSSLSDSRVPPRPPVAPRAGVGAPPPERSTADGHTTPTLPPRPSVEVGGGTQNETTTGTEATQNTTNQTVKSGSVRPFVPTKPSSLNSARRSSAPNLTPKPTGSSPTQPDPVKPSAAPVPAPKPPGPTKPPTPNQNQNQNQTPAPALRKVQTKAETSSSPTSSEPPLPPRPSSVKLLPLRPPPIKSTPGRPPPPTVSSASASSSNQIPPPKATPASSVPPANQLPPSHTSPPSANVTANQTQRAPKKGPPLPPRPKPGHPLFNSYMKQEVLIVLDDPSPSESQSVSSPVISPPQCLLDLDPQPEPGLDQDQSKPALEGLSDSQSILPAEQKEQPEPATVSGPRCVAVFDYEGEEEDELTFSQGDVIALLQLIGQEWGRGQIHGRIGIFPLSFTEVVEPLPQPSPGETKLSSMETAAIESSVPNTSEAPQSEREQTEQWAVALFDFPGQTAEDLSFQKGALIQVMEHVDAEWCRGRLEGREGLYPAAFTQPCSAQPITGQQAAVKGEAKALFDFTAESEDELTLKVGDVITQVESVDDQWILGVVGGKRGIVPKNYISFL